MRNSNCGATPFDFGNTEGLFITGDLLQELYDQKRDEQGPAPAEPGTEQQPAEKPETERPQR
jgi:hypothetical protein